MQHRNLSLQRKEMVMLAGLFARPCEEFEEEEVENPGSLFWNKFHRRREKSEAVQRSEKK